MREYLLGIMGTVLVCSLLTTLAPEGKTSAVIKGVARLACVLVIISPVLRFFKTGELNENAEEIFTENSIQTDGTFIQYYSEKRVRETEETLKKELETEYAPVTAVAIEWTMETEQFGKYYETEHIRVVRIVVNVPDEVSEEVRRDMSSYLTKNYCSEVLIE